MKRTAVRTLSLSGRLISLKYDFNDLKRLPEKYVVPEGENKYQVDLHSLSCICNDFKENRKKYPPGDIRRMCVHQVLSICRYLKKNMMLTDNSIIQRLVRTNSSDSRGIPLYEKAIFITGNTGRVSKPFQLCFLKSGEKFKLISAEEKSLSFSTYSKLIQKKRLAIEDFARNTDFSKGKVSKEIEIKYNFFDHKSSYMERAVQRLLGIMEGISADNNLNDMEVVGLKKWLMEYESLKIYDAFNEVSAKIEESLEDGILDIGEKEDILFWCKDYCYMNPVKSESSTLAIRRLHGFLHGLVIDDKLTDDEIYGLQAWLEIHKDLKYVWPFNDLINIVSEILSDGIITEDERTLLFDICSEFSEKIIDDAILHDDFYKMFGDRSSKIFQPLGYVAETDPKIIFKDSLFCFTGPAKTGKRAILHNIADKMGGICVYKAGQLDKRDKHIDYLVIGAYSSPAWVYSTYGRKIEKVIEMQREGKTVKIIKEEDFISQVPESLVHQCIKGSH